MEFQFPEDLEDLRRTSSAHQLQQKLSNQAKELQLDVRYKIIIRKRKYIYANCYQCQSHLRYRLLEAGYWILTAFQTFHTHEIKVKFDPIKHFIINLPPMATMKQVKAITVSKFAISSSQFYYIYNKVIQPRRSFQQYVQEMDEEGCFIHYEPFNKSTQRPDLMVIVTPLMKEYYAKYGHSISIDYTFNLFKDLSSMGKTYKAGFVVGMSFSKKIVPFAILLSDNQSKQTYYRSIKSFGQIMGSLPGIIVTDETLGAIHGIKELINDREFEGIHGLDTHHILKNIYLKLKNKQNIKHFAQLIKAEDQNRFELILQQALNALENQESHLLERFVKNAEYYCLSQMANIFMGRIPTTSPNQKCHDLLKNQAPISKPLPSILNNMIKVSHYLLSQCQEYRIQKIQIQKYFGFSELRLVRLQLDEKIFQIFTQQLSKSLKTQLIMQQERSIVYDFGNSNRYQLTEGQFQDRLIYLCSCKYQIKVGIPCRHQLRFLLVKGSRCLDYISSFWKVSTKLSLEKQKRKSTGKKTRRRRW